MGCTHKSLERPELCWQYQHSDRLGLGILLILAPELLGSALSTTKSWDSGPIFLPSLWAFYVTLSPLCVRATSSHSLQVPYLLKLVATKKIRMLVPTRELLIPVVLEESGNRHGGVL